MKVLPSVLAALVLLVGAQPAATATWQQVTADGGGNTDQVALARSSNGVLHVAWRNTRASSADLMHTVISPAGKVGATNTVVSGWVGVQNPALVWNGKTLAVFFGGWRSLDSNDPNHDLETATSYDGGLSWVPTFGSVVPVGAQAYGSPVAAAVLPNGFVLQAWSATTGTYVHAGLSSATPNHDYQAPLGHYGYDANIAADRGGRVELAWYSNATGHLGVHAQRVSSAGAPAGPVTTMPGTANMSVGMIGRTPLVARAGGGFYVAYATGYPALNRTRLWKVGGGGAPLIARTNRAGTSTATVAADPKGRLWVAWTAMAGGSPHVFARRSNRSATDFGAVVDAGRPKGASSVYKLDGSATTASLDVFALSSIGMASTTSTFHSRVLPGLAMTAAPKRLVGTVPTRVTFTVFDAGDRVAGASVSVAGHSGKTNAKGRVSFELTGRGRTLAASTAKKGYVGASLRLRVVPPPVRHR